MLLELLQEEAGASAQMEALVRETAGQLLESGILAEAVTVRLREDWDWPSRSAAGVKPPSSAMPTTVRIWSTVI